MHYSWSGVYMCVNENLLMERLRVVISRMLRIVEESSVRPRPLAPATGICLVLDHFHTSVDNLLPVFFNQFCIIIRYQFGRLVFLLLACWH